MAEGFPKEYRPQTDRRRFDIYHVERYMKTARKLVAEDIRALLTKESGDE